MFGRGIRGLPSARFRVEGTVGQVDRMVTRGPDLTIPAGPMLDYQLTGDLMIPS